MPIRLTRGIKILLITYFVIYLLQLASSALFGFELTPLLGLVPGYAVNQFWIWQLFTYSFLHGPPWHLFFNLMMLAFIGSEIESHWGTKRFFIFYFFCATVSAVAYLFFQLFSSTGLQTPMIGASGGIFGLLLAYGLIFGERVMLFMMLFPMKAKVFIWILAGLELLTLLHSPGAGVSSVAHLAGMAGGFGYLWGLAYLKAQSRKQPKASKTKKTKNRPSDHLKLVIDNARGFDEENNDKGPKTWH